MQSLPFLNAYSGQSVDELIALEGRYRIDSIVLAVEQAIDQSRGQDSLSSLTTAELTVLAVESLEREVNNGGYHQFFVNAGEYAWCIVDALRRIECSATAELTQQAIDALNLPVVNEDGIKAIFHDEDDERGAALGRLDAKYYEYPAEPVADRLFEYIKANRADIRF